MVDTSNNALVEAAQAGDQKAFADLVTKHYGMVHGLVYSKVNDWTVAEDVTQDVFTVAFTHLNTLKHPEAFLMWLRRIARNSALNWLRTQSYRRQLLDRHHQLDTKAKTVQEDPSGDAARHECRAHLDTAIQSLSPKVRDAMILFYFEGQTVTEGAEALGITVDTMKKRLRLGRARLQRYYKRRAQDDLEQLLPHQPQREAQVQRIMAGLVLGPAVPELGAAAAKSGPWLVIHDLLHGASPAVVKDSAAAVVSSAMTTAKSVAVAGTATVLTVGAGTTLVLAPLSGDQPAQALQAQANAPAPDEEALAAVMADGAPSAETVTRYIAVEELFNGPPSAQSGLKAGDRIIKVNGRPVATVTEDPRAALLPTPGAPVDVTVLRGEGTSAEEVNVTFVLPRLPRTYPDGDTP